MRKIFIFLLLLILTTSCVSAKTETVQFNSKKSQCINIEVYNTLGVQIRTVEFKAAQGINYYNIGKDINDNGVYFIAIKYNDDDDLPYWTKSVIVDIVEQPQY